MAKIVGKCLEMCPAKEIEMRESQRLLHKLEMLDGTQHNRYPTADKSRAVKCFARSAAGQSMQSAEELRPLDILIKTVEYLLKDVLENRIFSQIVLYEFIFDRLRAVRQDIVIQDIPIPSVISLMQPIVRYYALSGYSLCHEPRNFYDPVINATHLQESLKKLLLCYDNCDRFIQACKRRNIYVPNYDQIYLHHRPIIEAIYQLHNLGDSEAISRGIELPKAYRTPVFDICLKMGLLYKKGNYVRLCRLMRTLPSLLVAVAALHLPAIRKKALSVMSSGYQSTKFTFPLSELKEMLLYTTDECLRFDLYHYGVAHCEDRVIFNKNDFNEAARLINPRREWFVDEKLCNRNASSIILNGFI